MSFLLALKLHEILSLISNFLTCSDLYACIQASHQFHDAFAPYLWSTLIIQPPQEPKSMSRFPSKSALLHYQHYVKGLHIHNVFPSYYFTTFQDMLLELDLNTMGYRRYYPQCHGAVLKIILDIIAMNTRTLRQLSIQIAPSDHAVAINSLLWSTLRECRKVKSMRIEFLPVSLRVLESFWEICGGDYAAVRAHLAEIDGVGVNVVKPTDGCIELNHDSKPKVPSLVANAPTTIATNSSRSLAVIMCPFQEWPEKIYEDHTLTLPAVSSIELSGPSVLERVHMSVFGQTNLIRRCINLKSFIWHGGDNRSDTQRTMRLNIEAGTDADWFFGGLLGDIPQGPRKQWRKMDVGQYTEEIDIDPSGIWPLPHLESITTRWKSVSDLTIARLLKRLHRLKILELNGEFFGPLAFHELVCERVPFLAMASHPSQDSKHSSYQPPSLLSPTMGLQPRRLCSTVTVLDVSGSSLLSSENILELLELCPELEKFLAGLVDMTCILKRSNWACLKLKSLTIGFIFDASAASLDTITSWISSSDSNPALYIDTSSPIGPTDTESILKCLQKAVYFQLSRLRFIEFFKCTHWRTPVGVIQLQPKLDYGLYFLSSWTCIEKIRFDYSIPKMMTVEDMQWMLDNWPKLKSVDTHQFNDDKSINQQIEDLLRCKGIKRNVFY